MSRLKFASDNYKVCYDYGPNQSHTVFVEAENPEEAWKLVVKANKPATICKNYVCETIYYREDEVDTRIRDLQNKYMQLKAKMDTIRKISEE